MLPRISQPDTLDGTEFNLAEISFRVPRMAADRFFRSQAWKEPMTWLECLGETIFDVWDSAQERREFALFQQRRAATTEAQFAADENAIDELAQEAIAALPTHQNTLEVQLELIMDACDAVMKPTLLRNPAYAIAAE